MRRIDTIPAAARRILATLTSEPRVVNPANSVEHAGLDRLEDAGQAERVKVGGVAMWRLVAASASAA